MFKVLEFSILNYKVRKYSAFLDDTLKWWTSLEKFLKHSKMMRYFSVRCSQPRVCVKVLTTSTTAVATECSASCNTEASGACSPAFFHLIRRLSRPGCWVKSWIFGSVWVHGKIKEEIAQNNNTQIAAVECQRSKVNNNIIIWYKSPRNSEISPPFSKNTLKNTGIIRTQDCSIQITNSPNLKILQSCGFMEMAGTNIKPASSLLP